MNGRIRRRLEMVARARDFQRTHPLPDQSHATVAARLEEGLTRAQALAVEEDTGRLEAQATTMHRKVLRHDAETQLVRYLKRVGKVAARERPDLAKRFRVPPENASNAAFLARAWDLLTFARSEQEELARHGLAGAQLDALARVLTRFEEATERANMSRATHVGASAALTQVTGQLTELVGVLDVLNRTRFSTDQQLLAAWLSAINIAHPRKRAGQPAAPPVTPDLPRAA